jgi:hypothetical protein
MARVLPKDPDLETEAETYNTWHIQEWRKLRKKEHGPSFECGGFPWFVNSSTFLREIFSNTFVGVSCSFPMAITLSMLHFI